MFEISRAHPHGGCNAAAYTVASPDNAKEYIMKRICITYQMERKNETAETCIVLPMMEVVADNILKEQENSQYIKGLCAVSETLRHLAMMQGYSKAVFVCADEA